MATNKKVPQPVRDDFWAVGLAFLANRHLSIGQNKESQGTQRLCGENDTKSMTLNEGQQKTH